MSSSSSQVIVLVGASRGIGLEIARQLAPRTSTTIFVGVRTPSAEVQKLADAHPNIRIITTDLADMKSLISAAAEVEKQVGGVDVLFVNGAICIEGKLLKADIADVQAQFDVNAFGPLRALQAFLPLLRKSSTKKVINVSSTAGSLTYNEQYGALTTNHSAYNISKTALNAVTRASATELKEEGFTIIAICPGNVDTAIFQGASINYPKEALPALAPYQVSLSTSASSLIHVIDTVTPVMNGQFFNHKFESNPW